MKFRRGQKVVFIPENKLYEYGYTVSNERVVIYEVGECNMQDSRSIFVKNLRPARKSRWNKNIINEIIAVLEDEKRLQGESNQTGIDVAIDVLKEAKGDY